MARREKYQLPEPSEQELYLASAEDIILSKLHRYLRGGCVSERQWDDVKGVLKVQGNRLNYSYLKIAAKKRGVNELL